MKIMTFLMAIMTAALAFMVPVYAGDGVMKQINWTLPTHRTDMVSLDNVVTPGELLTDAELASVLIFYGTDSDAPIENYLLIFTSVRSAEVPDIPLKFAKQFAPGTHCFVLKVQDTDLQSSAFSNKMCLEVKGWPNPPTIISITMTLQKPESL